MTQIRPLDCTCIGKPEAWPNIGSQHGVWCEPCRDSGFAFAVTSRLMGFRPAPAQSAAGVAMQIGGLSDMSGLNNHVQQNQAAAEALDRFNATYGQQPAMPVPDRLATLTAELQAMTRERDAALLVRDAAVQTSHQCMDALVAERRARAAAGSKAPELVTFDEAQAARRARAAGFTDVSDRKSGTGWPPPYVSPQFDPATVMLADDFSAPNAPGDWLQPDADTPGLYVQCRNLEQRKAIMQALAAFKDPDANHVRDQALLAAFQDPDDPAPEPAKARVMPSNALRQPRATGWQAVR